MNRAENIIQKTSPWPLFCIIMAKLPEPGRVKTRLSETGQYNLPQAAAVASAMLRCITTRLAARGRVLLAVSPDGSGKAMRTHLPIDITRIRFIDQGTGSLGDRMTRAWLAAPQGQPTAFFGNDSPDVPDSLLDELADAAANYDICLGPTDDGGIWTLAARKPMPEMLGDIDWGTEQVYDQLCQRAQQLGATVAVLARWQDVDHPKDVSALLARVRKLSEQNPCLTIDPALLELQDTISAINVTADRP